MFLGKAIRPLGFSRRGDFIGEGASSGGGPGGLTMGGRGPWPRPPVVWLASVPPPSHLWSLRSFGKIGGSAFVSSNSENISCVTFLKHKNSRKQRTGTVASC
jgi:hypothetical protein